MAAWEHLDENSETHAGEHLIASSKRIFVNRNLKMANVHAVGFDMDHTIAVYCKQPLELLAYEATKAKLIRDKRYPDSIEALQYDPQLMIRGLVVDKRLGNILKVDQYNYVVRAYHGTRLLAKSERKRLYRNRRIRLSSQKYMSIDTLFGLPEAAIFAQLVDHFELHEKTRWRDYTKVYDDVRECIDRAHADDTIKKEIVANPAAYLIGDPELAVTLETFVHQGKKLFLLTNSEPYYTQVVMSHLLDGASGDFPSWREFFDIVVVSSGKPRFFHSDAALRELSPEEMEAAGMKPLEGRPIYMAGGGRNLETRLGYRGDEILYMGDHTFGDILRAKKRSRWRTVMVVEELAEEIQTENELRTAYEAIDELVANRNEIVFRIDRLQRRLSRMRGAHGNGGGGQEGSEAPSGPAAGGEIARELRDLENERESLNRDIDAKLEELERRFNPHWGKLFKCGEINSRFGHQVKDFACIYTSAVSNFRAYPESMYFRSPREIMPHEMSLERI